MLKPLQIGPLRLASPVMLAPMTGISDVPFRQLAQAFGAPLVFSEMVAGKEQLNGSAQSHRMADFRGTNRPHAVQLAGRDPAVMAEAARLNEGLGVDLIDINFGCPAKKVVGGLGGAAILKDEPLAARILDAVVKAVSVPVTLKFRLGWDDSSRNAPTIARIAQDCGIVSLTVHGRTRAQFYEGHADWHAIGEVKDAVGLPVIANGDIHDLASAEAALGITQADGIMIGRACQGRPWLAGQLADALVGREPVATPTGDALAGLMRDHIERLMGFYGETLGLRVARKHVGWYLANRPELAPAIGAFNRLSERGEMERWFHELSAWAVAA